MKLRTRMWMVLGLALLAAIVIDLGLTWHSVTKQQRADAEFNVDALRALLMSTRRVYHQQFIDSELPVTDASVGFLPAHAMHRISGDYRNWTNNGYFFNNVSDRPRNPANRADRHEQEAIDFFRGNPDAAERKQRIEDDEGKRWFHYTTPIRGEEYCLGCHGAEERAPESIQATYPGAAFGYVPGELFGVMSIRLPLERYERELWGRVASDALHGLVAFVLLFAALGVFLDHYVLRRLQSLRDGTSRLAEGQMSDRVPVEGGDELTELAMSFNAMAEVLDTQHQELCAGKAEIERHRDQLDEQVRIRTRELDEARIAAEQANQAKSAFLANMSHEIRTPLNAIVGLTHLMRRSHVTPQQADRLDKIDTAGQHLLQVINDVLDLAKVAAGKMTLNQGDFSLCSLFDHVRALVADSAEAKGLNVVVNLGDVPRWLHGDAGRLRQALLNLAGNAVKFTEAGSIGMCAELLDQREGELTVRFWVEDTGVGIAADVLPRVFDVFEQGDGSATRTYGGSGLGLAITRNLARLMGGEVGVESTPGKGSRFWFTARLERGHGVEPPNSQQPVTFDEMALLRRHSGQSVLLVEDHPIAREVALELLHAVHLEVDIAEDGAIAVGKAAARAYDLILMDMQMPRLDGLTATRRIRALPSATNTPILAMTANAFAEDREACLAAGMNDHISKPVTPETLYVALRKWLPAPDQRPAGSMRPVPPVHEAFPQVDGLDVAAGLKHTRGNSQVYRRVLSLFLGTHAQDHQALTDALTSGGGEPLRQRAHAIKGAAATLGAFRIRDRAFAVEMGVRADLPAEEVALLVEQLQAEMVALARNLRRHNVP